MKEKILNEMEIIFIQMKGGKKNENI